MIVIFRKHLRIVILLSSITLIIANKVDPPPKTVNLALETSFLFDPKDLQQNRNFLINIREFLDKVLMKLDSQEPRSRFRAKGKRSDSKKKLETRTNSIEKLEKKTEAGTSIKNVLDFVKNFGQIFVNLTGNKIAEPTKPKYKGPTAIPEKKIDSQEPRSSLRAKGKRKDTKPKLEERKDSIEKLEKKTETGTSINNVLDFVKKFVNLSGNKIAEPTKPKYKGPKAIPEKAKPDKHGKKDFKAIISNSITNWMRRYPEEMRPLINNTVNDISPLLNTFAKRTYNDDDAKIVVKLLKKKL